MGLSFWQVVVAALRSMATALTMAAFGGLLARNNGPLSPVVLRGLAKIAMLVTIPCLLFTNILQCTQDWSTEPCTNIQDTIGSAWPILFLPAFNVSIGAFFGWIIVLITKPPKNFRRATIAACAFGNSTGLPITLLTVIHSAFSPTTHLGAVNPVLFLSVYLLLYPMLQWGVGGAILGEEKETSINSINNDAFPHGDPREQFLNGDSVGAVPKLSFNAPEMVNNLSVQNSATYIHGYDDLISRSGDTPNERCSCIPTGLRKILPMVFKPAVLSVIIAIIFAVTPIRGVFVDLVDRNDNAPLEWFFDGLYRLGQAAVPLNMFLLGAKLSKGAQWGQVAWHTNLSIVFVKLIVMPSVGVGTVFFLSSFMHLSADIAPTFYLVVMIVTCTPTANSIMVMAELSGQNKEALASCIFTQYMFAPFILSGSVTLFVFLAQRIDLQGHP